MFLFSVFAPKSSKEPNEESTLDLTDPVVFFLAALHTALPVFQHCSGLLAVARSHSGLAAQCSPGFLFCVARVIRVELSVVEL